MMLTRYFIGFEAIEGTTRRQKYEEELLAEHKEMAASKVKAISSQAAGVEVPCEMIVIIGRFEIQTIGMIKARNPKKVILTHSKRSQWVR